MIEKVSKDKYRFIVSVGGRADRKRFCKTVTCSSKRELKKLYDEFEEECRQLPPTDITVQDLLESYIAYCRTLGRKQTTLRGYRVTAERCYPLIGAISAKDLTTYRLEKFIAEMGEKRLSAKTIKKYHRSAFGCL